MSCDNNVCGVGGWGGPLPGDPNNDITINARTVYGGINVVWSYPNVNSHAVAHNILYRGVSADFASAIELARVDGSIYYDRIDTVEDVTYFYWVKLVSINGTVNEPIGPASATATFIGKQTIESLSGLINESVLAQTLKTRIDGITLNHEALVNEIKDRLAANVALQNALTAVRGGIDEALTYVLQETTERITADSAMVDQINAIAVGLNDNAAAIVEERNVRVGKDDAMAQQITTLFTETGDNTAAIIAERTARTDRDSALARDITTLFAETGDNNAAISAERVARSNGDSSLAYSIDQLSSSVGSSIAAVNQTTTALTTRVNAVASSVTTVETTLNGNVATGQVGLTTTVNGLNGEVNSMWTAKVQTNNLIGGFGLANNGRVVDAGFDVDRFWIGRTSEGSVKPFIVSGNVVYIDKARIRNADIDTLKIAGNSVVTGVYAAGGPASVGANGSTILISRTVDIGDGSNSGLIVMGTVYCEGGSDDAIGIRMYIDGAVVGDQRASMRAGYGSLLPATGFGYPNSRFATVSMEVYIPGPGSVTIVSSSMSVLGGKR